MNIYKKSNTIWKFLKLIGKTPQTLRDWQKKGNFIPTYVTSAGTRYYSQEQLNHFLVINKKIIKQLLEDDIS